MSFLTIATAPKAFTNPHIATIQWNAIQSWMHLGPDVDVLLVGDEPGMADAVAEIGVRQVKEVARNATGTPLVSSIFDLMRRNSNSPVLVYVNADILLMPDFITAVRQLTSQAEDFLAVGQRWDLEVFSRLDFDPGWETQLRQHVTTKGSLHAPVGSDFFAFPRQIFTHIPDFAIGRAGWDNWMIYEARQHTWKVADLTPSVTVVHQNHDYSHLPGGLPHYRLPETADNTRMAGGRRVIFDLRDADYSLRDGSLQPIPRKGKKLWRELEILPLVRLHSPLLGELFFFLFHPLKAWGEWRGRLVYVFKKLVAKRGSH